MMLPDTIKAALGRSADYSPEFTARVAQLAKLLEADLGVSIRHDVDMNYRAGQSLSFEAKYDLPASARKGKGKGAVEVRIYVSSKAALFAIYCIDTSGTLLKSASLSLPVPADLLPAEVAGQVDLCRSRVVREGYTEVPRDLFDVSAPGCNTELDDLPATVFQCLFTEII